MAVIYVVSAEAEISLPCSKCKPLVHALGQLQPV